MRGATSTVGMAAVQLAKAVGARVIAACRRESSFEKLQAAGADHCVIDDERLSEHPWAERPNKMLELVGIKTLYDSLRTVTEPGYVCHTGNLGFVFTASDFNPIKDIPNGVYLTSFYSNYPTQAVIDDLFRLIRRGGIRPLYSKVFGMDEIATAHKLLETGGAGGKIVLRVS